MDVGCYWRDVIGGSQVVLHIVSVLYRRQLCIRLGSLAHLWGQLQYKQGKQGRQAAMLPDGTQKHSSINTP